MPLREDFQFSQASLQDFVDCARRFKLKYLVELAWPAVEVEPVEERERRMLLGQTFHHMVWQHMLGLPEERLSRMAQDPDLRRWWQNYLVHRPVTALGGDLDDVATYPEQSLMGEIAGHRVFAKYDLIVVRPEGGAVIFDWKTSGQRTPEGRLRARLQTRVYRSVLIQAGEHLNRGVPFDPDSVEMIYWFPEYPNAPARLPYNASRYEADQAYLEDLIQRIATVDDDAFYMTDGDMMCRYCPYRSYCDRGTTAGDLDEDLVVLDADAPLDHLDLDFEQIAEIEF